MDKKRFIFMDVLRLGAFFLVFFYHFLVRISENGLLMPETARKIYEFSNFHIATLGVSLFFMLSGAGLAISASKEWNVKNYYEKRMLRIYIPYYIAYAGIWLAMFVGKDGNIFEGDIPGIHFLFTLAGIDGYLKEFGVKTFSLGVGEWFLGCLVLMYLIFPLLWKLMKKRQKLLYGVLLYLYIMSCLGHLSPVPVHMNFYVKLLEFVFGMFFVTNQQMFVKHKKTILTAAILILVCMICPVQIPLPDAICITVLSAAVLAAVSYLEPILEGMEKLKGFLRKFGAYSFEMYLLHHWIIIALTSFASTKLSGEKGIVLLFAASLLVTILGAVLLKRIADGVRICYNKFLKF